MASTASDLLKFEKQTTGENPSTWGAKANTAMSRIEEAIADITNISLNALGGANYTLDDTQYDEHVDGSNTSESHVATIKATGTLDAAEKIIVPLRNKQYLVWNSTSGAFAVTIGGDTGDATEVPQGYLMRVICDGTNVKAAGTPFTLAGVQTLSLADESSDTTCFPLFATSATGYIEPKSGSNLTFDASNGILGATRMVAAFDGIVGGNTPAAATVVALTASGAVVFSDMDKFQVRVSSSIVNITGAGTAYTVVWDDEIFDVGAGFSSTAYTANRTGNFCLETALFLVGLTAAMTAGILTIVTSNRSYEKYFNPGAIRNASNQVTACHSIFADMDTGDTAVVTIKISNGAGDDADISGVGGTQSNSFFSGRQIP